MVTRQSCYPWLTLMKKTLKLHNQGSGNFAWQRRTMCAKPWHTPSHGQRMWKHYISFNLTHSLISRWIDREFPFLFQITMQVSFSAFLSFIPCPSGVSPKGFTSTWMASIFRKRLYSFLIWSAAYIWKTECVWLHKKEINKRNKEGIILYLKEIKAAFIFGIWSI